MFSSNPARANYHLAFSSGPTMSHCPLKMYTCGTVGKGVEDKAFELHTYLEYNLQTCTITKEKSGKHKIYSYLYESFFSGPLQNASPVQFICEPISKTLMELFEHGYATAGIGRV